MSFFCDCVGVTRIARTFSILNVSSGVSGATVVPLPEGFVVALLSSRVNSTAPTTTAATTTRTATTIFTRPPRACWGVCAPSAKTTWSVPGSATRTNDIDVTNS